MKQRLWLLTRSAFFTLVIPGSVLYYLPHIAGAFAHARSGQWLALALVPIVFGGTLLLYCIFEFAWVGLGTLAIIDPPRLLVGRGPYRYVRNPMYLGVVSVLDPDAVFARALTAGASQVFPVGEEYGWRLGRVVDPFGHHWEIGHPLA